MSNCLPSDRLAAAETVSVFSHLRPLWTACMFVGELAFFMTVIVIVYRYTGRDIRTSVAHFISPLSQHISLFEWTSPASLSAIFSTESFDRFCSNDFLLLVTKLWVVVRNALVSEVLWVAILLTGLSHLYTAHRGGRVLAER